MQVVKFLASIFLAVLIATGLFASAPILLAFFLVRICVVKQIAKFLRPDLGEMIGGMDAIFAINNSYCPSGSCLVFGVTKGNEFCEEKLREIFSQRILELEKDKKFSYEKFMKFWTNFLGFAFWKIEEKFDLKNHIRNFDYNGEISISSPTTEWELVELAGKFQNLEWWENRSPWEILLVKDFLTGDFEKCSVILFRMNHILLDGYSFINLARRLFQLSCELPGPTNNLGKFERKLTFCKFLALPLKMCFDIGNYLIEMRGLRTMSVNCGKRRNVCAMSGRIPVDLVKEIKNKFHVKFSTVIHAALVGAIRRALTEFGEDVPDSFNFAFPMPKPNHPDGLVNDVYLGQGIFPTKKMDQTEMLTKIEKIINGNSTSKLFATDIFKNFAAILPITWRTKLKCNLNRNVFVSLSNLPSAPTGLQHDRVFLSDLFLFVAGGNHGIMTILSGANGHLRLGLTMYRPKYENFLFKVSKYVEEELDLMAKAKWTNSLGLTLEQQI